MAAWLQMARSASNVYCSTCPLATKSWFIFFPIILLSLQSLSLLCFYFCLSQSVLNVAFFYFFCYFSIYLSISMYFSYTFFVLISLLFSMFIELLAFLYSNSFVYIIKSFFELYPYIHAFQKSAIKTELLYHSFLIRHIYLFH